MRLRSISCAVLHTAALLAAATALFAIAAMRLKSPAARDPAFPITRSTVPRGNPADADEIRTRWNTSVEPQLAEFRRTSRRSIGRALRFVTGFVNERKAGIPRFVHSALSLRGKWTFVRSRTPAWLGGDRTACESFLAQRFAENVLSVDELASAIEFSIHQHLSREEARENELLVRIRSDFADIPTPAFLAMRSADALREEFNRIISELPPKIGVSASADVVREIACLAGGGVAAQTAVRAAGGAASRMGVSGGILATGAGASAATIGLSLAAAVVLDQAVAAILDAVFDPSGALETRVAEMLDELMRQIIVGHPGSPGLKSTLQEIADERAAMRETALRQLILGGH